MNPALQLSLDTATDDDNCEQGGRGGGRHSNDSSIHPHERTVGVFCIPLTASCLQMRTQSLHEAQWVTQGLRADRVSQICLIPERPGLTHETSSLSQRSLLGARSRASVMVPGERRLITKGAGSCLSNGRATIHLLTYSQPQHASAHLHSSSLVPSAFVS